MRWRLGIPAAILLVAVVVSVAIVAEESADGAETTYTLSFNANGGGGAPSALKGTSSDGSYTFTVPETVPTNPGLTFKGWATTANGSAAVQPGESYTVSKSTTLFAVWEGRYTLNFNANGGEGAPSSISTVRAGGAEFTIPYEWPVKSGKAFKGWGSTSSGSVAYKPGSIIKINKSSVTLYAVWSDSPNTLTVNFVGGGELQPIVCESRDFSFAVVLPVAQEWTDEMFEGGSNAFRGWSSGKQHGSSVYEVGENTVQWGSPTLDLHAMWSVKAVRATLTFDANNGEDAPADMAGQTIGDSHVFIIPDGIPTKFGYLFKGWAANPTATSAAVRPGEQYTVATSSDGYAYEASVTLYAVWQQQVYISSQPETLLIKGEKWEYTPTTPFTIYTLTVTGPSWVKKASLANKVSGTPTEAGEYEVSLKATKIGYADYIQTFTLKVIDAWPVLEFMSDPSVSGQYLYVQEESE